MKLYKSLAASAMLLAAASTSISAQSFTVPAPELIMPMESQELFYGQVVVTWDFYELQALEDDLIGTFTFPDGSKKDVKGQIISETPEGAFQGREVHSEFNNCLSFRNVNVEDWEYVQQKGEWKLEIPGGLVNVNGVPNPAAQLSFKTTGGAEPEQTLEPGRVIYPSSLYGSFLSLFELSYNNEEISLADDVESVTLDVMVDGVKRSSAKGTITTIYETGENDDVEIPITIFYVTIDDFLSYLDGTIVDITIPQGIIIAPDGKVNPEQTVSFTLLPLASAEVSPTEGSTLTTNGIVTFYWENALSLQPNQGRITARPITGSDIRLDAVFNEDDASFELDLSQLPAGQYEIIMPEAFVLILLSESPAGDSYALNSEMAVSFIVSETLGISLLENDAETFRVFTIDGVKVLDTDNFEDLNILGKGLYVINGKKVMKHGSFI